MTAAPCSPASDEALFALCIETDLDGAAVLCEVLPALDLAVSAWQDARGDRPRVQAFFETRAEAVAARQRVRAMLKDLPIAAGRIAIRRVHREDWAESWKKYFRPERVSDRIVVRPSWCAFLPKAGDCVVEIDPGMSFGTGQHPTTRACLRFLDELGREGMAGSVLDIGCGSGILCVAAAKLGFSPVVGLDSDPVAVKAAKTNVARNGVADRARCGRGDLTEFCATRRYDVVIANILADIICEFAVSIAASVSERPGSALLLAGILSPQFPMVRRVYETHGFRLKRSISANEWESGRFERT
ncbi:MAG: 50S ribosomal protein L11 methyltransferase [Kiritimatiellae bacterium]|nr:50S ribosomal protein L11 methyltransferase [Kiritimatiellia bacterium]